MWIPDIALLTIAADLPLEALARMSGTSKDCSALLVKLMSKKAREHAAHRIARLVIEARTRLPSAPLRMEVRGALKLKFTDEANKSVLFTAEVKEGSVEIIASYIQSDGICSQCVGYIRAEITPSFPTTTGSVTLDSHIQNHDIPERQIEYSDGFDPVRALEWFPLDLLV
jgi:hypothetical protein